MAYGILFGLISAFIWATTSLAIKAQSDKIHPTSFNAFRMIVASLFTFALLPFFDGWQALTQVSSSSFIALAASSLIGIAIGDVMYFWSLTKIGASRALPLSGAYTLFTWLIAVPVLGEPVTLGAVAGTVLVLLGVYLLSPKQDDHIHTDPRTVRIATFAALGGAALWAIATTLLKMGMQDSASVLVVNAVRLPVAAVATTLVGYVQARGKLWDGYTRASLPKLTLLALYSTGIGMIVWTLTVEYAGAARASLLNTASPLIGVPLSVVFLRERVTRLVALGTLLSVAGVWLILLPK